MGPIDIPDPTPLFWFVGMMFLILTPLAVWKLIELVLFVCQHVHFS